MTEERESFPEIKHLRHLADTLAYFPNAPDVLNYRGTVKLHGTNMCASQEAGGDVRVFSRHRELGANKDNSGCHAWTMKRMPHFERLFEAVRSRSGCGDDVRVCIFGEFAGRGIQKRVGISAAEPFLAIFCVTIDGRRADLASFADLHDNEARIWNVLQFGTWDLLIRKADPMFVGSITEDLAERVGADCPAAKALGCPGAGEGIVWTCTDIDSSRLWFKSKCKAHSVCSAPPKKEKGKSDLQFAQEFAEAFVTEARLEQGLQYLQEMGLDAVPGNFIKWVVQDVVKEEGECSKDCKDAVARKASVWFKKKFV
jgi:hypothetical protein